MLKVERIYQSKWPIIKYFGKSHVKITTPIDELNECFHLHNRLFDDDEYHVFNMDYPYSEDIKVTFDYHRVYVKNDSSTMGFTYKEYDDGLLNQVVSLLGVIHKNIYTVSINDMTIHLYISRYYMAIDEIKFIVNNENVKCISISSSPININMSAFVNTIEQLLNSIANFLYKVYKDTKECDYYDRNKKVIGQFYNGNVYKSWDMLINEAMEDFTMLISVNILDEELPI